MSTSLRRLGCSEGAIHTLLGHVFVRVHTTLRVIPVMEAYVANHFRTIKVVRKTWVS
jgi:hypothetical protein